MAKQSWNELMRQMRTGDETARDILFRELQPWLKGYFRHRVHANDLDDLMQETLLAIHMAMPRFREGLSAYAWFAGIAKFKWIDQMRRQSRYPGELLSDHAVAGHEEEVLQSISLQRLLNELSPQRRQAINMLKIEGLSVAEAAEQSGQSESLVKVNVHRGMKSMTQRAQRSGRRRYMPVAHYEAAAVF